MNNNDTKSILARLRRGEINISEASSAITKLKSDIQSETTGPVITSVHYVEELSLSSASLARPAANEVTIDVRASAVNFPDILCIKGLYPTPPEFPYIPGFEVAGIVVEVGSSVVDITPGQEVVALTGRNLGGHATKVNVPADHTVRIPDNWSFEQACSLPVAFITVFNALKRANITPGESILIQSATGGCGLTAIQLARFYDLECFASSSRASKLSVLERLGIAHRINYLESEFDKDILSFTDGRGVDIVFNMLSGDAIQRGINCLASGGRYLEIAVHALKTSSKLDLSGLTSNQAFYSFDFRKQISEGRLVPKETLNEMVSMAENGLLVPIVSKVFPFDKIKEALTYVEQAKHIGKVVLSHTSSSTIDYSEKLISDIKSLSSRSPDPSRNNSIKIANFTKKPVTPSLTNTDIAIIGMAGRFPGSDNIDTFWENIANKKDSVSELPLKRFKLDTGVLSSISDKLYCRRMGVLCDVDKFDPLFFQINPVDAEWMDPQQRLFLLASWEALENAALDIDRLSSTSCGVFVGCSSTPYSLLSEKDGAHNSRNLLGEVTSILAARVSYFLNLKGPCLSIDTACSSSLVALATACDNLVLNNCEMAISGGVNVLPDASLHVKTCDAGMLSKDGKCFTFDDRANGFVPGEGVGVVVLKRLEDAINQQDIVHGVIKAWGVNQDGKTNGITAPSVMSQTKLQVDTYRKFNIDPKTISLVEAHGTGTRLGDPIEIEALIESFRASSHDTKFCALGSVKSNIGHLLAAAGISGVIKVLQAFRYKQLPPTLHFEKLNSHIQLDGSPFYVNTDLRPWSIGENCSRRACVSSFGFSGTNAHFVLEEFLAADNQGDSASEDRPNVLVLSACSNTQLRQYVQKIDDYIQRNASVSVRDMAYTLQVGRRTLDYRLAILFTGRGDLVNKIKSFLDNRTSGEGLLFGNSFEGLSKQLKRPKPSGGRIEEKAVVWVSGGAVEWEEIYAESPLPKRLSLPTYPFLKERFWLDNDNTNEKDKDKRFELEVETDGAYVVDHKINGRAVLPATAYLNFAFRAMYRRLGKSTESFSIEGVTWISPYFADCDNYLSVTLDSEIEKSAEGSEEMCRFVITSAKDKSQLDPTVLCRGTISSRTTSSESALFNLPATEPSIRAEKIYQYFHDQGLTYGPSHRNIEALWTWPEINTVVGRVRNNSGPLAMTEGFIDIGLLDSVLQVCVGFFIERDAKIPQIPYSLGKIDWKRRPGVLLWVEVKRSRSNLSQDRELEQGAIYTFNIYDERGELCFTVIDFVTKPASNHLLKGSTFDQDAQDLTLIPTWEVLEKSEHIQPQLQDQERSVLMINADDEQRQACVEYFEHVQEVDLPVNNDLDLWTRAISDHVNFTDIIFFICSSGEKSPRVTNDSISSDQQLGLYRVFALVKALIELSLYRKQLNFTIVTQNTYPVFSSQLFNPAHAGIVGLLESAHNEFSNWKFRHFDIDSIQAPQTHILLSYPSTADFVSLAYRYERWHRRVLRPLVSTSSRAHATAVESEALQSHMSQSRFSHHGVYVLIGGAGGLGSAWTEYLVQQYDIRAVWIGRRAIDANIQKRIDAVSQYGTAPIYIQADASNYESLKSAHDEVISCFGVIHGVVHSAIDLRDQSIARMTLDTFTGSLKSKVDSCINMAKVFSSSKPESIIFFSSIISFTRPAGQGNYSAGCNFSDSFAVYIETLWPCDVRVINWGYWGSIGIVSNANIRQQMKAQGIGSIEQEDAWPLIERAAASSYKQLAFVKVFKEIQMNGLINDSDHYQLETDVASETENVSCAYRLMLSNLTTQSEKVAAERLYEPLKSLRTPICETLWDQMYSANLLPKHHSSIEEVLEKVSEKYHPWLLATLGFFETCGFVEFRGQEVVTLKEDSLQLKKNWKSWREENQLEHGSEFYSLQQGERPYIKLLDASLGSLIEILTGRKRATDVFFPEGSSALVAPVYSESDNAIIFNDFIANMTASYVRGLIENNYRDDIRILEVGAGTGSAGQSIFHKLRPFKYAVEVYHYTDISASFFEKAKKEFGEDAPYIRCDVLDIETDPLDQGFREKSYDLIIASNVIHATKDILNSLKNVKKLLKNNGVLLMHELSGHSLFQHLTFGLLDGWWRGIDTHLRISGSPALHAETWRYCLEQCGFFAVETPLKFLQAGGSQLLASRSNGLLAMPRDPTQGEINSIKKSEASRTFESVTDLSSCDKHTDEDALLEDRQAGKKLDMKEDSFRREDLDRVAKEYLEDLLFKVIKITPKNIVSNKGFDKLGIDSIVQASIIKEMENDFGLLPATLLFQYPSPAELMEHLVDTYSHVLEKIFRKSSLVDKNITDTNNYKMAKKVSDTDIFPLKKEDDIYFTIENELNGEELTALAKEYLDGILFATIKLKPDNIIHEKVFDKLGVDSIVQATIIKKMEEDFGPLPATLLFEYPSPAELVGHLVDKYPHVFEKESTKNKSMVTDRYKPEKSKDTDDVQQQNTTDEYKDIDSNVDRQVSSNGTKKHAKDDIAIIGFSGRFPMCSHINQMWENLMSGENCISRADASRWNSKLEKSNHSLAQYGGFLNNLASFDNNPFNIEGGEKLNPNLQQLLEVVWEAMENAGYAKSYRENWQRETNAKTGVYVGTMYDQHHFEDEKIEELIYRSNESDWVLANRISHTFALTGPSMSVNTACSSSLTAIHLACESLRQGSISMAVVAAINLTLSPSKYESLNNARLLSLESKSKSFGDGDGFIPGEGASVFIFKRLADALQDSDAIRAVIKHSTLNHCGDRQMFGVPDPKQQANLIKTALIESKIDPETIGYIECAANGSRLGDAIEIVALKDAFRDVSPNFSCAIGSVKSNLGHLEAASGLSQLCKVVMQLESKTLVPTINSEPENPNLKLSDSPFYIQRKNEPWKPRKDTDESDFPRRCMINSFGAGGSYGNLIVEESPLARNIASCQKLEDAERVFCFSAATRFSLVRYLERFFNFLRSEESIDIATLEYSVWRMNHNLSTRAFVSANSIGQLLKGLEYLLNREWSDSDIGLPIYIAKAQNRLSPTENEIEAWVSNEVQDLHLPKYERDTKFYPLPSYCFDYDVIKQEQGAQLTNKRYDPLSSKQNSYQKLLEKISDGSLQKDQAWKEFQDIESKIVYHEP